MKSTIVGSSGYEANVTSDGKLEVSTNLGTVTVTDVTIKDATTGTNKLKVNADGSVNTTLTGSNLPLVASSAEIGKVQVSGSNVEVVTFNKSNLLAPRVAADYELRVVTAKNHYFTQMRRAINQEGKLLGEITNIYEQTIIISSTLDAKLNIKFGITDDTSANSFGHLMTEVDLWDMPEGNVAKKFTILTPEKGTLTPDPETGPRTFELPELRMPYPSFYLRLQAKTVPTTGEIQIMVCRRY